MKPGDDVFTAADLVPDPAPPRTRRKALVDGIAATVATIAAGIWAGATVGLIMGWAPLVFELTPGAKTGTALSAALTRFDTLAIGCAAVILGCEVARTFLARRTKRGPGAVAARLRRIIAIVLAGSAAYLALVLSPGTTRLLKVGAVDVATESGRRLAQLRGRAQLMGKGQVALAVVLIGLHVYTLKRREDDDDEPTLAPLPPGPGAQFGADSGEEH